LNGPRLKQQQGIEGFDRRSLCAESSLDLMVTGRDCRLVATVPEDGAGTGFLKQPQQVIKRVSLPNDKARTRCPQSSIQALERPVEPATRCPAWQPLTFSLRFPNENGDDHLAMSEGGVQSGIIVKPQIVSEPKN